MFVFLFIVLALIIDLVLGVDVCSYSSSDDSCSCVILVNGQWLGDLDRSSRGICDGASDIGGDDWDENNSVTSCDDDEVPNCGRALGATQTVKRRYYCIFASIINGAVIIRYITPIHKSLVLDQHPCMILSLRPTLAVVGGTNGLLGAIDPTGRLFLFINYLHYLFKFLSFTIFYCCNVCFL